jgi:hypothetical protein
LPERHRNWFHSGKGWVKYLKSGIVITIISFFILSGTILFTSCFQEPVTYIFEGIMQPGIVNAPPVEVVLDTVLPAAPNKLKVYRIETIDEKYIDDLAHRLGFNYMPGQPDDSNGPYTFIQGQDYQPGTRLPDGTQWIEVYKDGSLQLFTEGISFSNAPGNLPSFEEAEIIAGDWLVLNELYPAGVTEAKKGNGLVVTGDDTGLITPHSVTVRFQVELSDYAIYTHAASVEVGENGKILSAYINIMQLKEYEIVLIKSPEAALNLLKARLASPLADPPEAWESVINLRSFDRLSVTRVTLQYTSGGGYLQPVYVFEGSAFSTLEPSSETFKGKVDAVIRQTPFFKS